MCVLFKLLLRKTCIWAAYRTVHRVAHIKSNPKNIVTNIVNMPFIIVTTDISCNRIKASANTVGFFPAEAI